MARSKRVLKPSDLTPEQYQVCMLGGTEPPFSGKYNKNNGTGIYHCAVCDTPLFSSKTKYESGTGWPSFLNPAKDSKIKF